MNPSKLIVDMIEDFEINIMHISVLIILFDVYIKIK